MNYLSSVGGLSLQSCTSSVVRSLISDEVSEHLNWRGVNKFKIEGTFCAKLMIGMLLLFDNGYMLIHELIVVTHILFVSDAIMARKFEGADRCRVQTIIIVCLQRASARWMKKKKALEEAQSSELVSKHN